MRKVLVRPRIVWAVFLFLILQLSCAHKEPPSPSEEVRENFGTIGVALACFKPERSLQKRTSELASEALRGALEAEGKMYDMTTPGTGDFGQICCLFLTPFTMCGGALSGAGKAESVEKLDAESEAALRNAFQQVNVQELMRDRILRIARDRTNYTFVNLGDQGPSTPDEDFDYSSVANQDIHTVLEIAVLDAGLVGSAAIHPNLQFFMIARIRLIRAVDGEELYLSTLTYKGAMQRYSAWAVNNAHPFGQEFCTGSEEFSKRIVELLFALAWSGKVVSVEAGDSITVRRDGEQVKIDLYGIDTPVKGQAFGNEAEQFTSRMVLGKVVEVEVPFRDRYGSMGALVRVEGVSLNEELVKGGLAWVYSQHCLNSICDHLHFIEMNARVYKRGLWADSNPVPPWEFGRQEGK